MPDSTQLNKIISRAKKGSADAQKALFDTYLPYLSVVCRRYTRQQANEADAIQEAFIKIFEQLHLYDADRGSFKSWIRRIAINETLKFQRRYHTKEIMREDAIIPKHLVHRDIYSFDDEALMLLLKKMPEAYRDVFNLFVIDEYSHREISDMLGISEMQSRQKLSRARKWLRKILPVSLSMFLTTI